MTELDINRNKIIATFSKHWELNDEAHRIEHFTAVEQCATVINERLDLRQDPTLIMLAAFFHDLFAWSRVNHHKLSSAWVHGTDWELVARLSRPNKQMLGDACLHHRASFKGEFRGTFDALINSGDRGIPTGDITPMIQRSVLYAMQHNPKNIAKHVLNHMHEKFSSKGYARYPDFYQQTFDAELAAQRDIIDALTQQDVNEVIYSMFER